MVYVGWQMWFKLWNLVSHWFSTGSCPQTYAMVSLLQYTDGSCLRLLASLSHTWAGWWWVGRMTMYSCEVDLMPCLPLMLSCAWTLAAQFNTISWQFFLVWFLWPSRLYQLIQVLNFCSSCFLVIKLFILMTNLPSLWKIVPEPHGNLPTKNCCIPELLFPCPLSNTDSTIEIQF